MNQPISARHLEVASGLAGRFEDGRNLVTLFNELAQLLANSFPEKDLGSNALVSSGVEGHAKTMQTEPAHGTGFDLRENQASPAHPISESEREEVLPHEPEQGKRDHLTPQVPSCGAASEGTIWINGRLSKGPGVKTLGTASEEVCPNSQCKNGKIRFIVGLTLKTSESIYKETDCPDCRGTGKAKSPTPPAMTEEKTLGQIVRETWVEFAKTHHSPKPSWLVPWEELGPWDKEMDKRIGLAVATEALKRATDLRIKTLEKDLREAKAACNYLQSKLDYELNRKR